MARPPAGPQVRRLLVMVPWLLGNSPISLDDLAQAFDISVAQAEKDVWLAGAIGVPPYGGGNQVDLYIDDDGIVHISYQPILDRPPKLTPREGLILLASGRALLEVLGETAGGPLASALTKLEATLGRVPLAIDLQAPLYLDEIRTAVEEGRRLRIEYFSAWRDELTERDIDPHVAHERNGRWYVEAWCHRTNRMRRFRIDRIRSLADTGERFDPVRAPAPPHVYDPPDDAIEVELDLPVSERWVVEAYPTEWEERDGRLRVTLRAVGDAWLERLLLRVGAHARLVSPPELRDLGALAARRLLAALES